MIIDSLKRKFDRLNRNRLRAKAGINTRFEFFLSVIGEICGLVGLNGVRQNLMHSSMADRRKRAYLTENCYRLKDVKIPLFSRRDKREEVSFFSDVLDDTFYSYLYLEDNYDVNDIGYLDELVPEGFYIYADRTKGLDLNLRPGDVVIDAGAWIGDFAAYASAKGAVSYAFEPVPETFEILREVSRLNKNIVPVQAGLGAQKEELTMTVKKRGSSSGASISLLSRGIPLKVQITTLDDFVEENNLERVDFIKADIEGHERFMLQGAKNVLRKFAPRMAVCTYHLPDDPQVLESLIKEINPAYQVIQRRKKLFAYVK